MVYGVYGVLIYLFLQLPGGPQPSFGNTWLIETFLNFFKGLIVLIFVIDMEQVIISLKLLLADFKYMNWLIITITLI